MRCQKVATRFSIPLLFKLIALNCDHHECWEIEPLIIQHSETAFYDLFTGPVFGAQRRTIKTSPQSKYCCLSAFTVPLLPTTQVLQLEPLLCFAINTILSSFTLVFVFRKIQYCDYIRPILATNVPSAAIARTR